MVLKLQFVTAYFIQMFSFKVPDLSQRLEQLKGYFSEQTETFTQKILTYTDRFTEADKRDFDRLLEEIKRDVMERLTHFIDEKISTKSVSFETHITTYTQNTDTLREELEEFSQKLEEGTRKLKEKELQKENRLEHLSSLYARNLVLKKCMRIFKNYQKHRQEKKALKARLDGIYHKNLLKKSFFPWRGITYKDGYQNFVKRQTQKDIRNIHQQFGSIIEVLKQKIYETDQMIRVKKAAKGEFAYALSKNLLKTISNLSLEVMSLNQVTLRDQQFDESATHNFMAQINQVIKEKLQKVNQYRVTLHQEEVYESGERQKQSPENQGPGTALQDKKKQTKGKKISFAD